jgi:hypothetical protein
MFGDKSTGVITMVDNFSFNLSSVISSYMLGPVARQKPAIGG